MLYIMSQWNAYLHIWAQHELPLIIVKQTFKMYLDFLTSWPLTNVCQSFYPGLEANKMHRCQLHLAKQAYIHICKYIYMYPCVCMYIYTYVYIYITTSFFLTWDVWKRLVYDRIIHNHTYALKNTHPYPVSTSRCKGFQTLLFPNLKIKQSGYSYLVLRHCSIFFQSALSVWDHLSHSLPFHHWVSSLGLQHSRRANWHTTWFSKKSRNLLASPPVAVSWGYH